MCKRSAHEGSKIFSPTRRRLYLQETSLVLISARGWVDTTGHSAIGRMKSMKNPIYLIGNWTRDLLACSACLNQLRHRVPRRWFCILHFCKIYKMINVCLEGTILSRIVLVKLRVAQLWRNICLLWTALSPHPHPNFITITTTTCNLIMS